MQIVENIKVFWHIISVLSHIVHFGFIKDEMKGREEKRACDGIYLVV